MEGVDVSEAEGGRRGGGGVEGLGAGGGGAGLEVHRRRVGAVGEADGAAARAW